MYRGRLFQPILDKGRWLALRHGSGRRRPTLAAAVFTGLIFAAALTAPLSALASGSSPTAPAAPVIPPAPAEKPIRIGLGWGLTSAEISATGGLTVIAGGALLTAVAPGQSVAIRLVEGQVQVGAMAPVAAPVRLVPGTPEASNYVTYRGKPYRGEIELVLGRTGRLSVVNLINLEEYLLGVVPNEMPHSWPAEALKAQATAARTYAEANRGKQKADGFDLRSNTDDQAYGGINAEQPSTTEAVRATKGRVITVQGRLVPTYYHSSSGGHTENNENYWTGGVPQPYLRGVPDYDNVPDYNKLKGNPYYIWTHQLTPDEFAQRLKLAGYGVGIVKAVTPGPVSPSGRPIRWTIRGSIGEATLTMAQMRTALGLRAAAKAIQLQAEGAATVTAPPLPAPPPPPPHPQADPIYVVGAGGTVVSRPLEGSYVVGADGKAIQRPAGPAVALGVGTAVLVGRVIAALTPTPDPVPAPEPAVPKVIGFEVQGGGNGHGIGLSQWGAHGMALQGKTYDQILTHFYTGTKVETR